MDFLYEPTNQISNQDMLPGMLKVKRIKMMHRFDFEFGDILDRRLGATPTKEKNSSFFYFILFNSSILLR